MSSGSSVLEPVEPGESGRGRAGRLQFKPWWIRAHRWAALALGLVLLVQTTSGAVLLMQPEIMRWTHPDRFQSTASADPLSATEALAVVKNQRPELHAVSARLFRDVWMVAGEPENGMTETAYVDPGTGKITAVGASSPWIMRWLVNLHDCAFSCEDYPWYASWMKIPIIDTVTVATLVTGSLGVLLIFLCGSGMVIWWPTIRRFATGFRLRRGRGRYAWNLDLHKLVGILAVPLLLMWGISGASFEFDWPKQVYYWLLPGSDPDKPTPHKPGTGELISIEAAQAAALRLHPQAQVVGVSETTPAQPAGSYRFSLREGFDAYKDSAFPGQISVKIDSHGGGATDRPKSGGPIPQQYWENWRSGLHRGRIVPWVPRLVGVLFGLAPVLLAITGGTVLLIKRRSRRNRKRRRRLPAGATGPTAAPA